MKINVEEFWNRINDAGKLVIDKKFDDALGIYQGLIADIESDEVYKDNITKVLYSFNESMEELLFKYINGVKVETSRADIPTAAIYLQCGALLLSLRRADEAMEMLLKAKQWNPVNSDIHFELMEVFKVQDNKEEYVKLGKQAFKYAFTPKTLARCYRNMAYYYSELGRFDVAVACLSVSLGYDMDAEKEVRAELQYIGNTTGEMPAKPEIDDIKKIFEENEIPFGPDADVLGLSAAYGKNLFDEGSMKPAAYFLGILYNLTEDKEVKKMLDKAV